MKRWMLSLDSGATFLQEVHPVNAPGFTIDTDDSTGLVAKRVKMSSDLVFGGQSTPNRADYTFFKAYEDADDERCTPLFIRRERKCGSEWRVQWTGKFSTGGGRWDYNRCLFSVKPDVQDGYTCLLKKLGTKVNVMDVPPTTVKGIIIPSNIEFLACVSGDGGECLEAAAANNGWVAVYSASVCSGLGTLTIYWREKIITNCVDGDPVPPVGAGWTLLTDDCVDSGTATYVRTPADPWPFDDPTFVESGSTTPVEPAGDCSRWIHMGTALCDPLGPTYVHAWFCTDTGDAIEYERGRKLQDVIKYFLEKSECTVTEVVSDLFEWDPIGDAPGYVAGDNYVTGEKNQVDHLFLFQKSDVVLPDAISPAVRADLTFKQLLQWMRVMFRVKWDLTTDGKMRIEHLKFWAAVQGLDLTDGVEEAKLAGANAGTHVKDEIPQEERFTMEEAQGTDFVGVPIKYSGPCVTEEGELSNVEVTAPGLTTDLSFIDSDPDKISRNGFVMVATAAIDADYMVIIDFGALSVSLATNAPLSVANLQDAFWRWDRFLATGNMNNVETTFDAYLPNFEQTQVMVRWCCEMLDWDPRNTVKTPMGERFLGSRQGFVMRGELNDGKDLLMLTLRYAY